MYCLFKGFIYITKNNINGKCYIGKKVYDKNGMWKNYLGSGINIKRAIKKYGRENFDRTILANAFTTEDLNCLEKYYIEKFNATSNPMFYNIAAGGDGGNTLKGLSKEKYEERSKKISESSKGKVIPQDVIDKILETKRRNGTMKANWTEEGKERRRLSAKNRKKTREEIEKQIETRRRNGNMYLSEESKKKISIANSGSKNGMFGKTGELHPNYGKKSSDETRRKISENHADFSGENAPRKRAVVQLDIDGNYLNQFISAKLAADFVGGSNSKIIAVCRGNRITTCGYKWMYLEDYLERDKIS